MRQHKQGPTKIDTAQQQKETEQLVEFSKTEQLPQAKWCSHFFEEATQLRFVHCKPVAAYLEL